jgi:hypothetical protein
MGSTNSAMLSNRETPPALARQNGKCAVNGRWASILFCGMYVNLRTEKPVEGKRIRHCVSWDSFRWILLLGGIGGAVGVLDSLAGYPHYLGKCVCQGTRVRVPVVRRRECLSGWTK